MNRKNKHFKVNSRKILTNKTNYISLLQTVESNNVVSLLGNKKQTQIDEYGTGTIAIQDFVLEVKDYEKFKIGQSVAKLLDILVHISDTQKSEHITIRLDDYMKIRGYSKNSKNTARRQLRKDLKIIENLSFRYTDSKKLEWIEIKPWGGFHSLLNGVLTFSFSTAYYNLIQKGYLMFLHTDALKYSGRKHPYSYYFHRYITLHHRRNIGKNNENIIKVSTLIKQTPNFVDYEKEYIKRRFTERILEPFEKSLDAIKVFKWHFKDKVPENYTEFLNSKIIITWIEKYNPENILVK